VARMDRRGSNLRRRVRPRSDQPCARSRRQGKLLDGGGGAAAQGCTGCCCGCRGRHGSCEQCMHSKVCRRARLRSCSLFGLLLCFTLLRAPLGCDSSERYLRMNPAVLSEQRILQQLQVLTTPPSSCRRFSHSAPNCSLLLSRAGRQLHVAFAATVAAAVTVASSQMGVSRQSAADGTCPPRFASRTHALQLTRSVRSYGAPLSTCTNTGLFAAARSGSRIAAAACPSPRLLPAPAGSSPTRAPRPATRPRRRLRTSAALARFWRANATLGGSKFCRLSLSRLLRGPCCLLLLRASSSGDHRKDEMRQHPRVQPRLSFA
jgi:hypothetical protein